MLLNRQTTMTSVNDITVRQSKPGDVKFLVEFSGDGPTYLYNHRALTRIDPNYLLVAVDDFDNPVGFGGVCQSAPGIVFICNLIVRKDLRRKGVGRLIMKALHERAGDQNMVINGISAMIDSYRRRQITLYTFSLLCYVVTVTMDMKKCIQSKYETMTLSDDMWPSLIEYDKYVYPNFDRERILHAWFTDDQVRVVIAKDVGKIVGYGSIHKKTDTHYGISNVFVDNEIAMETILHDMLADLPEGTTVDFVLLGGKPLPKYIKHSVYIDKSALRMFNKFKIETNTDKMLLVSTHII